MEAKITQIINQNRIILTAINKAFPKNFIKGEVLLIDRALTESKKDARKAHFAFCNYIAENIETLPEDERQNIKTFENIYKNLTEAISQYLRIQVNYTTRVMVKNLAEVEIGRSLDDRELRKTKATDIFGLLDKCIEYAYNNFIDYEKPENARFDITPHLFEWDNIRELAGKNRQFTKK